MYKTKNCLRNHLDLNLAEKIIKMFLTYAKEKNNAKAQVCELGLPESDNLSEERREVKFYNTKKTLTIIFRCVVQENRIKDPVDFGCPDLFIQHVTDIDFESEDKSLVDIMQWRFEEYFNPQNKKIPKNLSNAIFFNGKERSDLKH